MPFQPTRLVLREIRIPFRFSFKHALAERREANNLILTIHAGRDQVGYGEVVPRPYLTGETIESAWVDIQQRWWPAVRTLTFDTAVPPTDALRHVYLHADAQRKTGSYAGVDLAIHDLWGRAKGTPASRMFGQTPTTQILTCPLGGGGVKVVKWISRVGKLLGFREFKLKTGRQDDAERLIAARRILGWRDLRVDANAGWTVEQTLEMADRLKRSGVSSIEQPIPAGDVEGLSRIQRDTGIAVMADESLCTRADAQALIAADAARLWNLRLAKVGGFSGFFEMLNLARAAGIRIHHGVLVGESPLLAAAARACGGLTDFAHVEYGFPRILLKELPFAGGPGGLTGRGRPLKATAGLGVEPIEDVLNRVTTRQVELD